MDNGCPIPPLAPKTVTLVDMVRNNDDDDDDDDERMCRRKVAVVANENMVPLC